MTLKKPTDVMPEDVAFDLADLVEHTHTGEYGYYLGDDGYAYAEVWNDSYHGVKKICRVRVTLEEVWHD